MGKLTNSKYKVTEESLRTKNERGVREIEAESGEL